MSRRIKFGNAARTLDDIADYIDPASMVTIRCKPCSDKAVRAARAATDIVFTDDDGPTGRTIPTGRWLFESVMPLMVNDDQQAMAIDVGTDTDAGVAYLAAVHEIDPDGGAPMPFGMMAAGGSTTGGRLYGVCPSCDRYITFTPTELDRNVGGTIRRR